MTLPLNVVEFFSGSGNLSRAFKKRGHNTFEIDKRKRTGTCVPDLRMDILKICPDHIPFEKCHVLWCSLPCTAFSHASGNFYLDHNGRLNEKADIYIKLLKKSLDLIEEINPVFYFIENPTGRLRYNKLMIDFLSRTCGTIKYCTLGSYGFDTTKPTDLFTNAHDLQLRTPLKFGRGYKCSGLKRFSNLTEVQRQTTPAALADEIMNYCEQKLWRSYPQLIKHHNGNYTTHNL